MATLTMGTSSTTTSIPVAVPYKPGYGSGISAADIATIALAIKDDKGNLHSIWPGAFSSSGLLYYPNRGVLKVLPGDYVGVDSNGWPVLVSAYSIATGGWTHS